MKVHLYRVDLENADETLSQALDRVGGQGLRDREVRLSDGKTVYLERCEPKRGLYEMDFTQRRTRNGPGYSRPGKETEDFDIEEAAGFGEQTAALWSEASGYMAVQYNHHGVRPGAVESYLAGLLLRGRRRDRGELPSLSLTHVVDDKAFARFLDSPRHMSLRFAVDAELITPEMANHLALGPALGLRKGTSAGRVEVSLSYGDGRRGGSLRRLKEIAQDLARFRGIRKLEAKVKNDGVDAAAEMLDLLEHRVTLVVPDENLTQTQGLRYDRGRLTAALRGVFESWLQQR